MTTETYPVVGMTCGHCVASVDSELRSVPGVTDVTIDLVAGGTSQVTVTSAEGLSNLFDMVGTLGRPWLRKTALFVPHERIAERARELGIAEVIVTGAGDDAMVEAMVRFFAPSP